MTEPVRVISLGAGVQSSTMALMYAAGELTPMPDCAIFADTKAEPGYVYEWLDWLETQLPFPVHRVIWEDGLTQNIEDSIAGGRFAGAPFFTEGTKRREGQLRRQCTREFKVQPMVRKLREMVGLKKGQRGPRNKVLVVQALGISFDELIRMRGSQQRWIQHIWPLVDRRIRRFDCIEWMEARGFPTPQRSACVYCPYHSDAEWQELRRDHPEDFAEAVRIDELIRDGTRGTTKKLYLHRSLTPIADADFRQPSDFGQVDAFGNECEGMCGV